MADPTNISKLTATEISSLPYTIVQDANDSGGTTFDLWFKYTRQSTNEIIGALSTGQGAYTPDVEIILEDDTPFVLGEPDQPVQLVLAAELGSTFWFFCNNVGGNHPDAVLTFNVQHAVDTTYAVGDIFIPCDQTEGVGFPGAILDPTTGAAKQLIADCPNGEAGDILPTTGIMLLQNVGKATFPAVAASMKLLRSDFTEIADFPYTRTTTVDRPISRLSDGLSFYSTEYDDATTWTLNQITAAGVLTVADSITGTTLMTAMCPNVANTILYLSGKTGANDNVIRQWDLVGHAYTTDFAAQVAGYIACHGLLTMSDGRVVALYQKNTVTRDLLVKVYSDVGVVLVSQSFGSDILSGISRIFYDIDDPNAFWLRKIATDNYLEYHKLATDDLSDLITPFITQSFQEGANISQDADPVRFGSSITCAGLILRATEVTTETFTIRRQRRWLLPQSESDNNMQIPTMQLLLRTGIGLLPDAAGSSTPLGVDPEVRLRISKDGGKTWGPERARSAGLRGEFKDRVTWTRATGNYRNAVGEVTVDAPVDWQWLAMLAKRGIIEGSS